MYIYKYALYNNINTYVVTNTWSWSIWSVYKIPMDIRFE